MALLSFVFVWVIIKVINIKNFSNKSSVVKNVRIKVQYENLLKSNNDKNYQNDTSYITKKLKDQILYLYESDHDKCGKNVDNIVKLLSMFRKHDDTSELLDDNPFILDYIFRNSA